MQLDQAGSRLWGRRASQSIADLLRRPSVPILLRTVFEARREQAEKQCRGRIVQRRGVRTNIALGETHVEFESECPRRRRYSRRNLMRRDAPD